MQADTYDYVIVGSGAAGSVLASRLTEDAGVTVCVLEAGPPDHHPYIHVPGGFIKLLFNEDFTWQFKTEPSEGTAGRQIPTTQGRTLGGSSSINGMVYNRGQRADFDNWAQRGNHGWGYVDVLPYFKRSERRIGGDDALFHGRQGNVPVTDMDWIHPVSEAFIDGAVGMGLPRNPDYNGATQAGVGYFQRAVQNGWRRGAARMFLHPARSRGNLDVRTHARAAAIVLDGKRAAGVRYIHDRDRTPHVVHVRREVIVSSGTANTAKLLQISGIGPGVLLQSIGAPVLHELRGVGENFRDHYAIRFVARVKNIGTMNELGSGVGLLGQIGRWAMGKPSIQRVLVLEDAGHDAGPRPARRLHASQLQGGFCRPARQFSRHDRRRLAAPAGKQRVCARSLARSVRESCHPAELPRASHRPTGAVGRHEARAQSAAHAGTCPLLRP
jgi:choline dehydrogenase